MANRTRSTSKEDRGGLSRSNAKALRAGQRSHGDDLISELFGERADHFVEHPLDGPDIIGAVPRATAGPRRQEPAVQTVSADDPVADRAKWFEGPGREGQATSTPIPVKSKPAAPMSIAAAAQQAAMTLAAEQALYPQPEILTGLTGEVYEDVLDSATRPPNTY